MNLFNHYKLQNAEQVEAAYQDNKDQITKDWPTFKKDYFDGKKVLQCDQRGEVTLNVFHLPNSREITNPYEEPQLKKQPLPETPAEAQPKAAEEPKPQPNQRRLYIDTVLEVIKLDIEEPKLTKLIKVIDLVNEDKGETYLQDILNLKD